MLSLLPLALAKLTTPVSKMASRRPSPRLPVPSAEQRIASLLQEVAFLEDLVERLQQTALMWENRARLAEALTSNVPEREPDDAPVAKRRRGGN